MPAFLRVASFFVVFRSRSVRLRRKIMLLGGSQVRLARGFLVCVGHISLHQAYSFGSSRPPGDGGQCAPPRDRFTKSNPHLLLALGRVPMQRSFEPCRGRRSSKVTGQNLAIRRVATVELPVGVLIRTKRGA